MNRIIKIFFLLTLVTSQAFAQSQANFPSRDEKNFFTGNTFATQPIRLIAPRSQGMTGLFHSISAQTQPSGIDSFGVIFSANYYSQSGFPSGTLKTSKLTPQLGITYTPIKMFELFLAINSIQTNDDPAPSDAIKQSYNLDYGAKLSFPLSSNWTGAFEYWGQKQSNVTTIPGSIYALNHSLYLITTYDAARKIRFHGNLGFQVNNNERLTVGGTDQREITVLNVYEGNLLPVALGLEYLFSWASASVEYSIDYVFGSTVGMLAQPQRITLGGRFFPTHDQALAAMVGVDVGVSSNSSTTVIKEPPLSFTLGVSYLFGIHQQNKDSTPPKEFEESKTPKKVETAKIEKSSGPGVVSGYITNIESGDPIEGAKIYFCNDSDTAVITDAAGQYRSKKLPEGSCEVRIEHPQYRTSHETVQVSEDAEQSFDFGLLLQTLEKGAMLIRVKDFEGNPTAATISFPEQAEIKSVKTNEFGQTKIELRPGTYIVRAKGGKFKPKTKEVTLTSKENLFVDFELSNEDDKPLPKKVDVGSASEKTSTESIPSVITIKFSNDQKQILVSQKILFQQGKALPTTDSIKVLDNLIVFLKKNLQIKKVEIRGHTDSSGNPKSNVDLSQERADVIKSYLAQKGIDPKRLTSKGYGSTKPMATNDTEEGREKNRRVEFMILEKSPAPK